MKQAAQFQLTASQGGWLRQFSAQDRTVLFQLTASQGGWRVGSGTSKVTGIISTHSLTRRLTLETFSIRLFSIFQLTASQGGWRRTQTLLYVFRGFQLTASQGGWPNLGISVRRFSHFNSQPHKEADANLRGFDASDVDFNSQPHKEADSPTQPLGGNNEISTHSLTRRLTLRSRFSGMNSSYFNSQPHKEADDLMTKTSSGSMSFQLTASQGGWRVKL